MLAYIKVKLINNTDAEFYCPHCNKLLLTVTGDTSEQELPSVCTYCEKAIDPTGVDLYKED